MTKQAKPFDAVEWARSLKPRTIRRCSVCNEPKIGKIVHLVATEWAEGRILPGACTWERIAEMVREQCGTRTTSTTIYRHLKSHAPDLYAKLDRFLRGAKEA